jgi:hypothetical protein
MRLLDNVIVEIVEVPDIHEDRPARPDDFFHPDAGFVHHEPGVEVGMARKGKGWAIPPQPTVTVPPPPDPLDQLRALLAGHPDLLDRVNAG